MASQREEIEEILVDASGEYEQMTAWEYAFTEVVTVPFQASLLGVYIEVKGFQISEADMLQCSVAHKQKQGQRQRWISVEELDDEMLPEDFGHLLLLYRAWLKGNY